WAGLPMLKIRPATSLESLSQSPKQNSRTKKNYVVGETHLHDRITDGVISVAAVVGRGRKQKEWRKYEYGRRCDEIGRALQGEGLEEGDRRSLCERYRQHGTTRDGKHAGGNAWDRSSTR